MMIKNKLLLGAFAATLLLNSSSLMAQKIDKKPLKEIKSKIISYSEAEKNFIQSVIPNTKFEKYKKSILDGFYTVYLKNGQILYVNPYKQLILFGEIWTNTGFSITQSDRKQFEAELTKKLANKLKFQDLTKHSLKVKSFKDSKYELVVFTDPLCPFCIRLENYLKNKKVDVLVNYTFAVRHKFQKEIAKGAIYLYDKDKKSFKKYLKETLTMANLMYSRQKGITKEQIDNLYKKYKINTKELSRVDNILNQMEKVAKKMQVRGTPMIYIFDKNTKKLVKFVRGANIPEIDKIIGKKK